MAKQDTSPTKIKDADYNEWSPTPYSIPKTSGYPETNIKTAGIKTRGNGAATKGTTARGPMA